MNTPELLEDCAEGLQAAANRAGQCDRVPATSDPAPLLTNRPAK
jgi:hypothetical protein